jgi:osmotically-inducible protein OsmY
MLGKDPVADSKLVRNVSQRLANRGLRAPCRIVVQSRGGEVTLSGNVQTLQQKQAAVQAARSVEGVERIVDQIQIKRVSKWQ